MAVQARAIETRRALIRAGVDLFVERGYLEVHPKDITAAAGLTTGAFYYHFKSKEEIVTAIIAEGWPEAQKVLAAYVESPETGLDKVIAMTFDVFDTVNRNRLQWIGFHLNQALGHLSPTARNEYFERVGMFLKLVGATMQPAELRGDVTPAQAAELIWIATNGAQLLSDALAERGPAVFTRLAAAWRATLRAIAAPESSTRLEAALEDIAARYPRTAKRQDDPPG